MRIHVYIAFLLLPIYLQSQITVSPDAIPTSGDSIFTVVDNLPMDISVGNPGEDQFWNFTSLQGAFTQTLVYQDAAQGSYADEFLSANLFLDVGGGVEIYYNNSNGQLKELGLISPDPTGLVGNTVAGKYSSPFVIRRAPLTFGDQLIQDTDLRITIPGDAIPDTITSMLPAVPDSIRVSTAINRADVVDAWGTLQLQMESYDVIRETRIESRSTTIEILTFLGWVDVTELAGDVFPVSNLDDTTTSYHFFDEISKEAIAIVSVDDLGTPETVIFKRPAMMTSISTVDLKNAYGIFASPNPAYGVVRFSFANLDPGRYELKLMNILGKTVWKTNEIINGDKTITTDLSHLRRGTYLYALSDSKNRRLFTKRLVIVSP